LFWTPFPKTPIQHKSRAHVHESRGSQKAAETIAAHSAQNRECAPKQSEWHTSTTRVDKITRAIAETHARYAPSRTDLVEAFKYPRGRPKVHPRLRKLAALAVLQHVVHSIGCKIWPAWQPTNVTKSNHERWHGRGRQADRQTDRPTGTEQSKLPVRNVMQRAHFKRQRNPKTLRGKGLLVKIPSTQPSAAKLRAERERRQTSQRDRRLPAQRFPQDS